MRRWRRRPQRRMGRPGLFAELIGAEQGLFRWRVVQVTWRVASSNSVLIEVWPMHSPTLKASSPSVVARRSVACGGGSCGQD